MLNVDISPDSTPAQILRLLFVLYWFSAKQTGRVEGKGGMRLDAESLQGTG